MGQIDRHGQSRGASVPDTAKIDYDNTVLDWMDTICAASTMALSAGRGPLLRDGGRCYGTKASNGRRRHHRRSSNFGPAAAGKPGLLGRALPTAGNFSSFVSDPGHPVTDKYAEDSGAHDYRYLATRTDLLTFDTGAALDRHRNHGSHRCAYFSELRLPGRGCLGAAVRRRSGRGVWNEMSPGIEVQRASYRDMAKGVNCFVQSNLRSPRRGSGHQQCLPRRGIAFGYRYRARFFHTIAEPAKRDLETLGAKTRKASIRIYHDRTHASHVVLPVVAQ